MYCTNPRVSQTLFFALPSLFRSTHLLLRGHKIHFSTGFTTARRFSCIHNYGSTTLTKMKIFKHLKPQSNIFWSLTNLEVAYANNNNHIVWRIILSLHVNLSIPGTLHIHLLACILTYKVISRFCICSGMFCFLSSFLRDSTYCLEKPRKLFYRKKNYLIFSVT